MTEIEQQPKLWQADHNDLVFADLCNALYERELKKLAIETSLPHKFLLKRIASLPYYIKRASERIIEYYSPLDLDSQNASWLYRQPTECPGQKQNSELIKKFYQQHAKIALVVPIYRHELGKEQLSLDSIDGIDFNSSRIHTNEHGWFDFDGTPKDLENHDQVLLKPMKVTMTCACSGHRWRNHKRTSARALSLREMLLATNINWKNFAKLGD